MQTIIILLDPSKLKNPDTSLSYLVPAEAEEFTENKVYDNGFEFFDDDIMGIWLETENAEKYYPEIIRLLKEKEFCGNNLSLTAQILISEKECAEREDCRIVYPV